MTNCLVKSFEVTELPVRTAKWVLRKLWIICGSDDMFVRVYNYNTTELVKAFEAHTDYIRCISVHPTFPYILTCSDDMLIKLWDWDKGWACTQVFEGHSHYVMQAAFNPKDTNTFASASLDRTIKVWSIGQSSPNFTLEGHEKGVNCVEYFGGGDRPYLISGADDKFVKIWDYQTKSCVQTLEGHAHNVSTVCFHPELPVIISGSEDGTLRIWHSTTYRLENTLNYGLERVWAIGVMKGSNAVSIGYDEGTVMFKIGREDPVASMDSSGKIIWSKHNDIQTVNVKSLPTDYDFHDGDRLPLMVKDLGSCDLYPQSLVHGPNGRFVTACGDGEYIIYTALAWRNKSFGTALDFGWSVDSSEFAVRESPSRIKVFNQFKEKISFRPHFAVEGLFGGFLLGLRSTDFICFYDWAESRVIRRIDVSVRNLWWSDSGEFVAISSESSFFVLKYNAAATLDAFAKDVLDEEGVEDAFELVAEIGESVRTGVWVGDCFIYNNSEWRLNYCVGTEVTTIFHLDRPMYILGYLAAQNRVYLIDKEFNVVSYTLLLSLLEYKTLVLREELEAAEDILPTIPTDQHNTIARFLESRSFVADALRVATDPDYKFDLAVQLGELHIARNLVDEVNPVNAEKKWKLLGELSLSTGDIYLASTCLAACGDLSGQLLLSSAYASPEFLDRISTAAVKKGKHNVAFVCLFLLNKVDSCIDLLCSTGRLPEAAFMARTYAPSKVSDIVALWKNDLARVNKKAAEALADPTEYKNMFPNFDYALQADMLNRKMFNDDGEPPLNNSGFKVAGVDYTAELDAGGTKRLVESAACSDNGVSSKDVDLEPELPTFDLPERNSEGGGALSEDAANEDSQEEVEAS